MRTHEKKLREYASLLSSYSGKIRLTGPSDPEILWNDHILDCLYSVSFLPQSGSVLDVGSGGGLPGLVWALCCPHLQVTLLDSVRKKCGALTEMASAMKLNNVRIVCARCEEYAVKEREIYLLAAARALAAADVLLEYLAPFVAVSGEVLAFKGPLYLEELKPMEGKWSRLCLSAPKIHPYTTDKKERYLLLWKKEAPLHSRFPRRIGVAEKSKWWR